MGCILYQLCSLRHPFLDETDLDILEGKILKGDYDPIPNHYSNELKDLVNSCLSVNPDDRPDAVEILNRIKEIQQD